MCTSKQDETMFLDDIVSMIRSVGLAFSSTTMQQNCLWIKRDQIVADRGKGRNRERKTKIFPKKEILNLFILRLTVVEWRVPFRAHHEIEMTMHARRVFMDYYGNHIILEYFNALKFVLLVETLPPGSSSYSCTRLLMRFSHIWRHHQRVGGS